MEFVTLHELSVYLDVSVRVLRHRLRQLLQTGKLIENQDCRRDDFVDDTHFVWRVDPVAFMRATGLRSVNEPDNRAQPAATQPVNQRPAAATERANTGEQTLPKVDIKTPGMEREMLDLLKDQVRVKDGQIADLSEQNKTLSTLNQKLNGAVLHQSDQIQNLLRLTGGKTDAVELATEMDNQAGSAANSTAAGGAAAKAA